MRKLLLSLTAVAAVATPLVTVSAPAQAYAGTPGCVTRTEFRAVTHGMTQLQVARKFGSYMHPYWGMTTYTYTGDYGNDIDRQYRVCNAAGRPMSYWDGEVTVDFESAYHTYTGTSYGPVRETSKTRTTY